jgi:hypothetical protein
LWKLTPITPFFQIQILFRISDFSILKECVFQSKKEVTRSLQSLKKYLTNTIPSTVASTQGESVGWVAGHEPTQPAPLSKIIGGTTSA